jgi:hypothetical protein
MVTRAPRENKRPAIPGPSSMISTGAPSLTGYFRGRAGTTRRAVLGVPVFVGDTAASGATAVFGDAAVFGVPVLGVTLLGAVMVNAPYKCVVTCVSCMPARPEQLTGEPGDLA